MQDHLKALLETFSHIPTREEFVAAFKTAMDLIAKTELKLSEKLDTKHSQNTEEIRGLMADVESAMKEMRSATDSTFAQMKKRAMESITAMFAKMDVQGQMDKMYAEHEEMMEKMEKSMPDHEKMMGEMKAMIPAPTPSDTPEQVRDKLETLKDDERLDISAIKGLDEKLEKRISAIPSRGGGVSAGAVAHAFKYIAHTEEPVGTIDGVNTTYTVKNTIWWIAGFTINGEQIAELPNFTYANKTITFATALPAAYSGKDWEIKYIGS